jgi:hypothetical protein
VAVDTLLRTFDVMVILITTAIDQLKIEDCEVCVEACCRVSLLQHILPGVLEVSAVSVNTLVK